MKFKIKDKVQYIGETYWFRDNASKEGKIKSFSDSGKLANVLFNDRQSLACYEGELELIKGDKE